MQTGSSTVMSPAPMRRDAERPWPSVSRQSSIDSVLPAYTQRTEAEPHAHVSSLIGTSVDLSRLSQVSQLLSCILERKPLIKGSVVYPLSFTGRTLIETLTSMITQYAQVSPCFELDPTALEDTAHQLALSMAHSLKTQLYVHEADWEEQDITNDLGGVYMLSTDSLSTKKDVPGQDAVHGIHTQLFVVSQDIHVALSATAAAACMTAAEGERPTGIISPLTHCYSPTCALTHGQGCYSPSCPRQNAALAQVHVSQEMEPGESLSAAKAWVEIFPQSVVSSLPREEVKRQNAIHEFIQKEEAFLRDLQLLTLFCSKLQALAAPTPTLALPPDAPLTGEALTSFVEDVFGPVFTLLPRIAQFVDHMHERQREQGPVIQCMGDVVTRAALDWRTEYVSYVTHYPAALAHLKAECESNARMQRFVDDCRRYPAAGRHPLDNFLFRPPARLQRYHLHLESILKHTSEYSDDRDALQLAIEVLDEQCLVAQSGVEATEARLDMRALANQLTAKRLDDYIDMNLLDARHQLLHRSRVFRRPDNFEFEWTQLEAILTNQFLVLVKPRAHDDPEAGAPSSRRKLVLSRKPIPVVCLGSGGFDLAPTGRGSISRHWMPTNVSEMYPFQVWHKLHTNQSPITLYVCTRDEREEWRRALETLPLTSPHTFVRTDLSGDVFSARAEPSETYALVKDAPWARPDVTCATTWLWRDRVLLVAIGTTEGIWMGRYGDPPTLRKVLHMKGVTQCAVLQEYRRFLVLADKSLIAYDLEALVPSGQGTLSAAPMRIGSGRDVHFFSYGHVHATPMLVYAKRKTTETSVRLLTPQTSLDAAGQTMLTGFQLVHKFYVYPEALQIQCVRDGVLVSTPRTVYTYRFTSHMLVPLLSLRQNDERAHALVRQWEAGVVLGVFHDAERGWLMCYDRGAFFVDEHGTMVHMECTFQWEKAVDRVVLADQHVFACSSTHVEVHEARTGRLVQLHEGQDIQMLVHNDTEHALGTPPILVERVPFGTTQVQRVVAYQQRS